MAYRLKDIKTPQDFNYEKELKAILKLLQSWDIKATPKGYAEFMKNYTDYQGMEELPEEELIKSFDGCGDGSISTSGLPIRLTREHVGYEDHNQVNGGPLEVLIGALLTHGLVIGQRMGEVDHNTEPYRRIDRIEHAFIMSGGDDHDNPDKELAAIYRKEFHALINDKRSLDEITKQFEGERRALSWGRFLPIITQYVEEHRNFVAYQSSEDKVLAQIYGYIHEQTGSTARYDAFIGTMRAEHGIIINKDGPAFKIHTRFIKKEAVNG